MSDVDPLAVPDPVTELEQERYFVEEDPVGATLEPDIDPSDYDPRMEFDDDLPGVEGHLHDAIHDLLD